MKTTKRILASVLSVILAFSCFAVVPAFAEDLSTLETYEKVTGVTLVNQQLPAGYDKDNLTKDFSDLAAMITARVNPAFGGVLDNTLQLSGLDNTFVAGKLAGRTNLLAGVGGKMYYGNGTVANAAFAPANITDGNITTNWYNGSILGSNAEKGWQPEEGQPVVYGDDRAATNSFDYQIMYDLGEEKEIDTFYQFGFIRPILQNTTYKVYVGNDPDTIYSDENEVFYYNAYNVHSTYQENLSFNAIRNTTYASATNGLPDGQWVEFKGDKKPIGQYVGFRVYDAAVVGSSGYPGWVLIGELGVLGEKAPEPPFVTGGNLTHLDTTSAYGVDYATKVAASTIELNQKYTANIQLSNMVGSAFGKKVENDTNLIKKVRFKGYSGSWSELGETSLGNITDMIYYNYDDAGHAGTAFGGGSTLNNISYEAVTQAAGGTVVYGANRIANDYYDVLVTAELSKRTEIEKILYGGHVAMNVASRTYAIYVSDNADDLYNAENQVFLFNNYGLADTYRFNGNNSGTGRGCEGPYLEFTGDTVPVGKYVGFKFYDASNFSVGQLSIYDLFVSGTELPDALTIADSDTVYSGTNAYADKVAKLNASLNDKYMATLQLADLTGNTLASKVEGETNQLESGEYQTWADRGTDNWNTSVNIDSLTDFGYVGNGTATQFGSNTILNATGYNKETFAAAGDTAEYKGAARVTNNRYDMLLTFELKGLTAIDKLYMVGHPNPQLSPFLYEVYVGDDKATLYTAENKVFYYDYSAAAGSGEGWKFNGSSGSGNRTSEIQYLEFRGDVLPTGKYVGFKIYDAAEHTYYGACNIYDIGVYGDVTEFTASNYVSYSFGTTSKNTVVNVGKSGGATILDAEGNEAETVKMGDTITFKAEPVTDSRHTFLGWYNGDTKVSGDLEYTTTFDGTALEAKYSTDLIFLMTPGENVVAKSSFTNCKPSFGVVDWLYDAEEDAMLIKGQKKTIQGDNPDTEEVEESYEAETLNSALVSTFTIDGKNVYTTQYEPWTTYKYSVTLKATGKNLFTTAAANGFNFQNQTEQTGYIKYDVTKNQDYVTYDFYFNSGAADYNGAATRSTKFISNNLFNFSGLPDGTNVYVKEMAIEKVNTLMVGNADNATVTPYGAFKPHITDQTSVIANADNTAYGGLTAANAIEALVYDSLAESKVIGSADNGKAMFTAQAADGYDVTAVKVNGQVVTADENGVYTYVGAAVDDGIDHDFLADGTKTYVVDVETAVHVHEEVEIPAVPATCTEPGSTAGVKCATCGEILQAPEAIDPLGHTEETVPGYAATCEETGLTDGTVCTVCGETVTEQEVIPALGHKMELNAEENALVCANNCGKEIAVYVVKFVNKNGDLIHQAIVEQANPYLTADDISAAEAAIPEIYGYTFANWDKGLDEEIIANTTVTALYNKNAETYTVTVNYVSREPEVITDLSYDAKLTINDPAATQWLIGGNVFAIGSEITMFVAGDMEITASEEDISATPSVTIIHDQAIAYEDSNTYVTFAHVNAADKVISEIGFIYITGTTYSITGEEGFNMANLDSIDRKYVKATLPRVGSDFMVSYEGITKAQGAQRYARAYVIFEGDDQVYYSNVVGKTFNVQ